MCTLLLVVTNMMVAENKDRFDASNTTRGRSNVHGRNFKSLVAAGAWEISGFNYGRDKCACCGRPITRVLRLTNSSHSAAVERDPQYAFPEEISIGIVCGPIVFVESCAGFYSEPTREWERQYQIWKKWIEFVMLCVQNKDIWESLPEEFCKPIDHFLEVGWEGESTTGNWWRLRDAKRKVLRTKRLDNKKPSMRQLYYNVRVLLSVASHLNIHPIGEWKVTTSDYSNINISKNIRFR